MTDSRTTAAVVYVVDDDRSVRAALEDLLDSVGLKAFGFGSTQEFLTHWRSQPPDVPACLVLDIRMPGQSGTEFHRQMADLGLRLPTIFITGHGDIPMSVQAMKAGAIEFLTKPFRDQDLLDAIQHGIDKDRQRRSDDGSRQTLSERWNELSRGEQDVVRLVVSGLLNKQAAAELGVSEITVKVRRAQAMKKLQARSFADLIRAVDRLGLS